MILNVINLKMNIILFLVQTFIIKFLLIYHYLKKLKKTKIIQEASTRFFGPGTSIQVYYKDQLFNSKEECASHFNLNLMDLESLLIDPTKPEWNYALGFSFFRLTQRTRLLVVHSKIYLNMRLASSANNLSVRNGFKRMKNDPNWKYLDELSDEEKTKIPNLERQIEKAFRSTKNIPLNHLDPIDAEIIEELLPDR